MLGCDCLGVPMLFGVGFRLVQSSKKTIYVWFKWV